MMYKNLLEMQINKEQNSGNGMFVSQKKLWDYIFGLPEYVRSYAVDEMGQIYDNISIIHGSGKEMLYGPHYTEFMNIKYCMVKDELVSKIDEYYNLSLNED